MNVSLVRGASRSDNQYEFFVMVKSQEPALRECRVAIDDLLKQKPELRGLVCGSTTLGNLRTELKL